jgi:Spy/CpxP family protein refolding chaperone
MSLRRVRVAGLMLAATVALPARSEAQGGPPRNAPTEVRRGERPIEQQLQHRIAAIMKERLSLSDEQLQQLTEVTQRFERQRMAVRGEEYRMRMTLRRQLMAGDSASQETVADVLERMPGMERRRIDLMEAEQRELARFLTPVQRARYIALQEEIRRNMEQIRERRGSSDGTSPHMMPQGGSGVRPPGSMPPSTRGGTRPPGGMP